MEGGREMDLNNEQVTETTKPKQTATKISENQSSEANGLVPPPDGGWGWMVVLSSFLIHVITGGIGYSFGIFYVEFLDYFKGGKGETAWVGSIVDGLSLTVGPVASILTNKYGCRATTIAGAIIASAGYVLSLAAPNLYFLYFSFGVMSGLGFGLIYLPAIVSVGYYFEEKRAVATGLAACGSGLGAFIFNPFSKYLIDGFGWRGALLIEAGLILNCVICGALFRPLVHKEKVVDNKDQSNNFHVNDSKLESLRDTDKASCSIFQTIGDNITSSNHIKNQVALQLNDGSMILSDGVINNPSGSALRPSPLGKGECGSWEMKRLLSEENGHSHHHPKRSHLEPGDSVYQNGSLQELNSQRSQATLHTVSLASIPGEETDLTKKVCCCTVSADVYDTLKQMCDFSLLKDVIFLMFAVSNFLTNIGFNVPFIFLIDRAIDEGIAEEDAKWLVSAVGISNMVGRVFFGVLADRQCVNRLFLYNMALTFCGVATALCPLCFNYPLLILYACIFGIFIGVYVSLTSVVLVDLLGLEMLTNSFGLLLMFQGIATFIGPPIAGWLYEGNGSYDVSFIVAGVVVATSGIMLFFIPLVKRCLELPQPGINSLTENGEKDGKHIVCHD